MANQANSERSSENGEQSEAIWLRALFMLIFVVIYGVAEAVVFVVAIVQLGWLAFTEHRNDRLVRLAHSLSVFVYEIVAYWTFTQDEKPFPFSDWPTPWDDDRSGS
jgi:hypothetical protein